MENIQIRASSLSELFDCPARWEAKHLLHMRLPVSGAARLGTAVHAGTGLYDLCRLEDDPITPDEAAGAVVDTIFSKDEDVDWSEMSQKDAEKIAIPLHRLYCKKIAPGQDYVAVEALCDNLTLTDIGLTLTGTVDRVRVTPEGFGIADIKTSKTAVDKYGNVKTKEHAAQIAVYELLASQELGLSIDAPAQIIGLQAAKKAQRAGIGEIHNARQMLLGEDGEPGLLEWAASMIHAGTFYGNPRSTLCNPKYCPKYQICKWRK